MEKPIFAPAFRALSSVGLEHHLDRVGVTGSNPVVLTEMWEDIMQMASSQFFIGKCVIGWSSSPFCPLLCGVFPAREMLVRLTA